MTFPFRPPCVAELMNNRQRISLIIGFGFLLCAFLIVPWRAHVPALHVPNSLRVVYGDAYSFARLQSVRFDLPESLPASNIPFYAPFWETNYTVCLWDEVPEAAAWSTAMKSTRSARSDAWHMALALPDAPDHFAAVKLLPKGTQEALRKLDPLFDDAEGPAFYRAFEERQPPTTRTEEESKAHDDKMFDKILAEKEIYNGNSTPSPEFIPSGSLGAWLSVLQRHSMEGVITLDAARLVLECMIISVATAMICFILGR
jgi:hypothetical protein